MDDETSLPARSGAIAASQWRQIVDSAIDTAIVSTDPDGRVTSWSEGARRMLGWDEAEMLGHTLERIFPPEDRARGQFALEMADAAAKGRGGNDGGWRLRKDGSRFWATGDVSPMREDGRIVGFVKILRDRTEGRRTEEALREESRLLEVLNRAGSALSRETDLQRLVQIVTDVGVELTGAEFGAFFYNVVNASGERYMLYTLSGAPAGAFSHFPMPHKTEVLKPTYDGVGIVRSDDITKDPRYGRHGPFHGMPKGHLPARSYLAVPVMSRSGEVIGGLLFGHREPGRFTERSERGLTGLAAEAAVAIDNARLSQSREREIQVRRRAEESLRDMNATLEQQVTERTEQLRRNEEALLQSQKMEAVGQLAGGIAHDFNNLLQVIAGNLEILERNLPPENARLRRAAGQALAGAQRAAALTRRLLGFSRRQPLDPRPVDVNRLMGGMSELLYRALGETVEVEAVQGAGLWRIEADPNELEAAILNLALNARDAMGEGGRLTIETANVQIDKAYAANHPEVHPGRYVMLSVSDTGSGMDEETLAHAFEPFFTTKPIGKGTGLGLSQVYGFATQSGGHVKICSKPGHGTTVKLYLPRLVAGTIEAPETETPKPPRGVADEVVLVVEDDADVRAFTVETLRDLGYRVLEAADGPTALAQLEAHPAVDLLFTDVILPNGMTGVDIAAQARRLRPGIGVLFTTGYAATLPYGRLEGGMHLVAKPFTGAALADKVRDVLDRPSAESRAG